jgi:anti-sigma regulatory factor (Ser/Thr protein kinase)
MNASAEFLSDRAELLRIEPFTQDFADRAGLGSKDLFALQIVVEELVTNVIDYGEVPVGELACTVDLSIEGGGNLVVMIKDRGRPYNPLLREEPDVTLPAELRPIGGLGVHFCKKLTDAQHYERVGEWNILTLRKKLDS